MQGYVHNSLKKIDDHLSNLETYVKQETKAAS